MSAGTARGGPTRPGRMWSVLALWQRLNLRPLPHQQGSFALRAGAVIELVAMTRPGYRVRPAVPSASPDGRGPPAARPTSALARPARPDHLTGRAARNDGVRQTAPGLRPGGHRQEVTMQVVLEGVELRVVRMPLAEPFVTARGTRR